MGVAICVLNNYYCFLFVLQWMVVGLNGHLGAVALQPVEWVCVLEHEIAQTLPHKEMELTVLVIPPALRAAT